MTANSNRQWSRRDFVAATALTAAGGAGILSACGQGTGDGAPSATSANGLALNGGAAHRYARVEPLFDGRVTIEGCETEFQQMGIGDLNTNVLSGPQTLDVTEVGLHPFMLGYANDGVRAYTLLPIFPLRTFRHKSVFIRTDRGIDGPEDLRGKTIATPGYASTSLTWIRGIFEEEYGVRPGDIDWVIAAADSSADVSGKVSKQEQATPEGITIRPGPAGLDESDLLESGEVDALFHAVEPRAFLEGDPRVARLFPDYRATERAYFAKTGIFPIMHVIAVKKSLLEEHPWLAAAVFQAYSQAKMMTYASMSKLGWADDMLPWYAQEMEETTALMGQNFYSYGLDGNRPTLEALFRYSHQQGLSSRELSVEELFHPESLEFTESPA